MSGASAWCITDTTEGLTEFSFSWTIRNFRNKMETYENGKGDFSDIFNVNVGGETTAWKLQCLPNGQKRDDRGNVSLFLLCANTEGLNKPLSWSIEILNEGSEEVKETANYTFDKLNAMGWGKFVSHEELLAVDNKLLPDDCLNIKCLLKFWDSGEVITSGTSLPNPTLDKEKEQEEACLVMLELLQTGDMSDVEVVCGDRTFYCHKVVLVSKSPVFRAAFQHNMKEKNTGKITIQGIDPDTVADMLTFIYGGDIQGIEDKADKLIAAADQYNLKHLKVYCEDLLAQSLNITNCLDYLALAHLYSPDKLKPLVIQFVVENSKEVVEQENWEEKLTAFPKVLAEVFKEMTKKLPKTKK